MDAAPYYAPTYFPPSYFYGLTAQASSVSSTNAAPYYAPTYFPPSYFYGLMAQASSVSSTNAAPYYAPTYFPPSYFYGGAPPSSIVVPVVTESQGRDRAPYEALLGLLRATGVFEEVIFGASTQRSQAGSDSYPLAVVTPKGWEESDDYDPTSISRRVSFAVTVVVKGQDGCSEFDQLDQLSSAIQGVVDRSDLGGTCLGPLTKIRSGRYGSSTHYPEQSVELEGEFASIIEP